MAKKEQTENLIERRQQQQQGGGGGGGVETLDIKEMGKKEERDGDEEVEESNKNEPIGGKRSAIMA